MVGFTGIWLKIGTSRYSSAVKDMDVEGLHIIQFVLIFIKFCSNEYTLTITSCYLALHDRSFIFASIY